MTLTNLSIYYTWKNIKSEYNSNKFKISAPTWNDDFNAPTWNDGSYSGSDIQDYFEYIIKKHDTFTDNPPIQIYVNKIKNRTVFKVKTGYKLELLTEETMQLSGSSKNNSHQKASKVLFIFVPNKQFGQLITITPHSLTVLKKTNAEFSFIEI